MTKSSGFRLVAVAVSATLAASSASAICKDKERPHTIGYVSAWGSTTELHLEWTAGVFPKHVFQENEYYDIAVRKDSPGGEIVALYNGVGPLIADATGQVSATIPGLQPGTGYCFAVRGRTESGTEGCSGVFPAKWNCHATRKEVTREDAAAAAFCRDYADQAGAAGRESQQLQCGDAGPRWSPDVPMHLDWCMGLGGDQTLPNSERDARTAGLAACRQRIAAMREVVQKPSGVGAATMAPRDVGIVQQRPGVAGLNEVMQPPSGSIGGVQIPGGKGGQREIPGLPAPDVGPGYALVCHGGGGMVTTEYNQMVSIIFVRAAHGSAKAAPGPGECAWVDRAVGANEPQTLVYLGGGTIAQELLQRAKKPGLFQVHAANNNAGALAVVSLD